MGAESALKFAASQPSAVTDVVLVDPTDANAKWDITSRLRNWTETRKIPSYTTCLLEEI